MGLPIKLLLLFLFPDIRLHCLMKINPRVVDVVYQQLGLRVSSEVPNTEKLMNARGRRPIAFIVSRCLEPLMKHEARVVDITSEMNQYRIIQCYIVGIFF